MVGHHWWPRRPEKGAQEMRPVTRPTDTRLQETGAQHGTQETAPSSATGRQERRPETRDRRATEQYCAPPRDCEGGGQTRVARHRERKSQLGNARTASDAQTAPGAQTAGRPQKAQQRPEDSANVAGAFQPGEWRPFPAEAFQHSRLGNLLLSQRCGAMRRCGTGDRC